VPVGATMGSDPVLAGTVRLAVRTWTLLAALALVALVVGWSVGSAAAAASAVAGVGLSALLFGLSVSLLWWCTTRGSRDSVVGVFVGGFGVRLAAYPVILAQLAQTSWLHAEALAAGVGVSLVITLTAELLWLARSPQLFHVDPEAGRPTTLSPATRS
jgi:hypothetical protein